jgi:hypothetical protein
VHFVLPFQFEEPITEYTQLILQAEAIDGSTVNCQFQCSSFLDYLGRWFHVPLSQVLSPSGYTYPGVEANTVGATSSTGTQDGSTGIVNAGPNASSVDSSDPEGSEVIWSGQTVTASNPFDAITANLTDSPTADPIQVPSLSSLLLDAEVLGYDINYDFDPFETGSFLYWGASTLYSIPSLIGGMLLHDVFGLPNEWLLANNGAEPLSGYTAGPSSILPGLAQGFQFLLHGADGDQGLLGYLDPSTYTTTGTDTSTLSSDLSALSADLTGGTSAGADLSGLGADLTSLF